MRIEHKLSPALAAQAQQTIAQYREIRQLYLAALGQVKEAEIELAASQRALAQYVAIVSQTERLPPVVSGQYQLNNEGTALIGEVADTVSPPPAAATDNASPDQVWPRMTNGSGAAIEGDRGMDDV